jgi:hypothetical protein
VTMPGMTADEAIHAIREAFEVRDRAREELARMEALARQNGGLPFASAERQIALVKRILGEEGSE